MLVVELAFYRYQHHVFDRIVEKNTVYFGLSPLNRF